MKRIVYLDASSERPFIALKDAVIELKSSHDMAGVLMKLGPFEAIACGEGPGSYTGMRVALALASALSLSKRMPLVTVSALYGLAPQQNGSFHAMLDARSGGVYYLAGRKDDGNIIFENEPGKAPSLGLGDFALSPRIAPLQVRFKDSPVQWIEKLPDPELIFSRIEEKLAKGDYSMEGHGKLLYLGNPVCI